MQISENNRFVSFALDSALVKFDVWKRALLIPEITRKLASEIDGHMSMYMCVCVYICETNQQYIGLATGVLHSSDKMTDICYALVHYWALCLGTADECDCSSQFIFLLRYLRSSEKADLKHSDLNGDSNPDLCDGGLVLHQLSCQANWELGHVSRKSRELFGPEKPFVKVRPAYSVKLVFSFVVKGIKIKITAKFRASRRFRFEDTKRIMSSEIRPKSFGTFEKRAPGSYASRGYSHRWWIQM